MADQQLEKLKSELLKGNRRALAKAITLIESTRSADAAAAEELLAGIMAATGKAVRIGISGIPGVGKSTFIESFGNYLIDQGKSVAVLAVDPSSPVSGGSIMGDRTRMETLSSNPRSFIRPSPTAGTIGGVARKTRESILACEAAGFDIVLIETVGVGQSEVVVSSMVDTFLILQMPHTGDELQGIKKGIIELADIIAITKADGPTAKGALRAQKSLQQALHLVKNASEWMPPVLLCSGLEGKGLSEIWKAIQDFLFDQQTKGFFIRRRENQAFQWFQAELNEQVKERLSHKDFSKLTQQVKAGIIPASKAARLAMDQIFKN